MKMITNTSKSRLLFTISSLVLGLSVNMIQAQNAPNYPAFDGFNTPNDAGGLLGTPNAGLWYGTPNVNMYWTNVDAAGSLTSGSLYVYANWAASDAADNFAMGIAFQTNYVQFNSTSNLINGYVYTNVEFDIKWDTNISTIPLDTWNATGDPQGIGIGYLTMPGVGQTQFGNSNAYIPDSASNGWVHMSLPIARTSYPGIDQVMGLWFKKYYNGPLGTMAYFLDNVTFDGGPPLPPPAITMSTQVGVKGLQVVATGSNPYGRQGLVAYNNNMAWVGQASPVSYALKILKYPSSGNPNFVSHIFLYPGSGTEAEPDWNEANVVFLDIENNNSGGGSMTFRWKTNAPASNGSPGYYSGGSPSIGSSTMVGTWLLTFVGDSNVTMTSPDGTTTNFSFVAASSFANSGGFSFNFGIMGNSAGNLGQSVLFASVGVTNAGAPGTSLYDDFTTDSSLDISQGGGGTWIYATDDSTQTNAVFLTSPVSNTLFTWPYPNGYNFVMETNASLSNPGGWSTNTGLTTLTSGNTLKITVPTAQLPKAPMFFRLLQNTNIP